MQKNNLPFTLDQNEVILMTIKRHWITQAFIGMLFLCFLLLISILFFLYSPITRIVGVSVFWCFLGIFCISSLSVLLIFWINIELDILIITNKRCIQWEQKRFLHREKKEFSLSHIQEIHSKISGLLPTLFGYGEITISTANNTNMIKIPYAPHPDDTISAIQKIIEQESQEKKL